MPDLARLAEEASSEQVMAWISNAEKQQPYVKNHNAWGARYDVDKLVTSEGWKSLRRWGAQNGYVCSHIDFEDVSGLSIIKHCGYRLRAGAWKLQKDSPACKVPYPSLAL